MRPRYVVAAGVMGLVWWGVLLLPGQTAAVLKDSGWIAGVALVLASIGTSILLRPLILADRGQWRSIVFGPFVGAFLFAVLLALGTWIRQGFRALNYMDLFILMPFWILLGTLLHFWIVGPVSWISHRVMRWAAAGGNSTGAWVIQAPPRQE